MAEFRIRKAVESDLQEIIRLWKQNIKTINTPSDIADFFHQSPNYFFVAVCTSGTSKKTDEKLIGFVGGAIRSGHGHISGIAVDKEYRNRRVGEKLIKAVERKFIDDAFETVTLEVRRSNRVAMRFYEKQGYKPSYIVKGYYADGEDAVVYAKRI
ncbi:MAG: GNAT family N-acetyltransferase [Candidatus Methanospirareceae archaeon]